MPAVPPAQELSATSTGTAEAPASSSAPEPTPAPASTPQDATIELGDVRLGAVGAESAVRDPRGSDGPVFVDESGRRSRRFRRLGVAVAVACAGYAAVIVATLLSGNSAAPWLPVPGQHEDKPAGKVDTSPLPSVSATPTTTPPGAGTVTAPVVGAEAGGTAVPAGGAPAGADASPSTEPEDGTASAPAADTGTTGSPTPSAPATDVSPAPSATGTATAPAPTATPSGRTHTPPGHTRRPHPKLSL
ncbi:hypothetical protein [Streptomyces sp. Ru62]|uniref:hypothetical protein n=1 Tax=Streptomyces sp. Ru62 TaxID=2080745 RepID=UPI0021562AE7|nr:hypothetical protein [Streptomyces sp. Ru62]